MRNIPTPENLTAAVQPLDTALVEITHTGAEWERFWNVIAQAFPGREADARCLDDTEYYALRQNDETVGTAIVSIEGASFVTLFNIAVLADRRGTGLGRALMEKLDERLSPRFASAILYTENKNIPFYEAAGFSISTMIRSPCLHAMHKSLG